jgi:diamine N-acetyltransferase
MEVILRPLKLSDAAISIQWRNDPSIWTFTGASPNMIVTKEVEEGWIRRVNAIPGDLRRAICVGNQYVGNIYIVKNEDSRFEYHVFIGDKEYWGKGVAFKASILILEEAAERAIEEVFLKVRSEHKKAIRLYEELGFHCIDELDNILIMKKTIG